MGGTVARVELKLNIEMNESRRALIKASCDLT